MVSKRLLLTFISLIALVLLLIGCNDDKKKESEEENNKFGIDRLRIGSGATGGTYYTLGGDLASIIEAATGVKTEVLTSNGAEENISLLQKKDIEIALTQTDFATYASEGQKMFNGKKADKMLALGALYPESIQIVTLANSDIMSVYDLRGKTVAIGEEGSGTRAHAEEILEIHGITLNDINNQNLSFDDSTTGLQDGTIDAAFITAGTPTGAIEGLGATHDIKLVPLEEDKIHLLQSDFPFYIKDSIPAGTYESADDVSTIGVQALLIVQKDLDDELVYTMTKAIFENIDKINHEKSHHITLENALMGVNVDIHPGALKYYKEKGIITE